jgi:hypothetical protein
METASQPASSPPPAGTPRTVAGPPEQRRSWWKRRSGGARAALIIVPALAIAGAGVAIALVASPSSSQEHAAPTHTATVDTAALAAHEKYLKCKQEVAPLMNQLHEIDSRLDVGLNYDEYTNKVGDVRVAYDRVSGAIGGPECLAGVGIPAENALNQYVKASNIWGDCFDNVDCDTDSIQPSLQAHWTQASLAIERADRGLKRIDSATS